MRLRKIIPVFTIVLLLTVFWLLGIQTAAAGPSTTWYFAEGYTGDGFNTWLTFENPTTSEITATITYYFSDGSAPVTRIKTLAPFARKTVDVNTDVGSGKDVAIKIESTINIVAERSMYFNYLNKWEGGHTTLGANTTDTTWYFAEGYTGENFDTWLTLANPNASASDVTITYMFRGGEAPVTKNISLDPTSRKTIIFSAFPSFLVPPHNLFDGSSLL